MTEKERLTALNELIRERDNLKEERQSVNEEILSSTLGKARKHLNVKIKRLNILERDIITGEGDFDPAQLTIEEYLERFDGDEDADDEAASSVEEELESEYDDE